MKINLNKSNLTKIEATMGMLKSDHSNSGATNSLVEILEDSFPGYKFDVKIIPQTEPRKLFVMSVYPELTTINKIIEAVMSNKNIDSIKKLWEENKVWTIEIDEQLLDMDNVSEKELTAIVLHELGHVVYSNSIPNRVSLILKYEVLKTNFRNKAMLKNNFFRDIMSLPVLDACISDGKRTQSSIKEELKADKFAKKYGYAKDLASILTKLMNSNKYPNNLDIDEKIVKDTDFSIQMMDDFRTRRDNLTRKALLSMKENCVSPYISDVLVHLESGLFENSDTSISVYSGRKTEFMQELADKMVDEYIKESFGLKKKLDRIDPADIDYIEIKINSMKSETDRMMVVSYIHNKLDLVEYYKSILENPNISRKYYIPHTSKDLEIMTKRLYVLRDMAMRYKIPDQRVKLLISWPDGYEG